MITRHVPDLRECWGEARGHGEGFMKGGALHLNSTLNQLCTKTSIVCLLLVQSPILHQKSIDEFSA